MIPPGVLFQVEEMRELLDRALSEARAAQDALDELRSVLRADRESEARFLLNVRDMADYAQAGANPGQMAAALRDIRDAVVGILSSFEKRPI